MAQPTQIHMVDCNWMNTMAQIIVKLQFPFYSLYIFFNCASSKQMHALDGLFVWSLSIVKKHPNSLYWSCHCHTHLCFFFPIITWNNENRRIFQICLSQYDWFTRYLSSVDDCGFITLYCCDNLTLYVWKRASIDFGAP